MSNAPIVTKYLPDSRQLVLTIPEGLTWPNAVEKRIIQRQTRNGHQYALVPHQFADHVPYLQERIDVAHPIEYQYDWPSAKGFVPKKYQIKSASLATIWPKFLNQNGMGTGKTLTALWAYDYLMSIGYISRCLVLAPLSTLTEVWASHIMQHFPHRTVSMLTGAKSTRVKRLNRLSDFYLVNHAGMVVLYEELMDRPDINASIFDEVSEIRNLTRVYNHYMTWATQEGRPWRMGLTATPTPHEPADAFALGKFLENPQTPSSKAAFKAKVMERNIFSGRWESKEGCEASVAQLLVPSVRFTRDELDIPETTYSHRTVPMTSDQSKSFEIMKETLRVELEQGVITAANGAVKMRKLLQICSGGIRHTEENTEHFIDATPRWKEVVDIINQCGEKVLIFIPEKSVGIPSLNAYLSKHHLPPLVVHGGVPKGQRDEMYHEFQHNKKDKRVMIAQPQVMAHGLNFSAATCIVWVTPNNSSNVFVQANGRIPRMDQQHKTNIIMLSGTTFERRLYQVLIDKENFQQKVLEILLTA